MFFSMSFHVVLRLLRGGKVGIGMLLTKLRSCKHRNPKWPFWKQRSKLGGKTLDNGHDAR